MKTISFGGMGYVVEVDEDLFESLHGKKYGRVSIDDGKSWMTLEKTFKAFMKELVKVAKEKSKVLAGALESGKVVFKHDSGVHIGYSPVSCMVSHVNENGELQKDKTWKPWMKMCWNMDDKGNVTIASNYLPYPSGKNSNVFANWVESIHE